MKHKLLFLLGLMFVSVYIVQAANTLKVQGVQMAPGGNIPLNIELENTTGNLMGWQCDIVLPKGLSLALKANGKPAATLGNRFSATEHTISSNVLSNGAYRFIATSMDGEAIPNTSGTLFSVTLQADASLTLGTTLTGKIQNIEFNTQDNQKLIFNDVSFTVTLPAPSIDITKYISAMSAGGAIMQTNDLITSGSQLSWRFTNSSSESVTLKSMQLIDGKTGAEGNVMSVNTIVEAGQTVGYATTIGALGIHAPVTCRFKYEYYGVEYSIDAVYSNDFTLSIKASGNGSVTYGGSTIRNSTKAFSVDRYASATFTFTPDDGFRVKSVKVNNSIVTSSVTNNRYSISMVTRDTNVEVEFEEIPIPTYTLSITVSGNGSVSYDNNIIRNTTNTYSVNGGNSVVLSITPDNGYRISVVRDDDVDVSSKVSNGKYEISNLSKNKAIEVGFIANKYKLTYTIDGVVYKTYEIEYGTTIIPEAGPVKEGYSFSGWSEIPGKMPNKDITITGTFTVNKYKLTYIVDGAVYKSNEIEYGTKITPEAEPSKAGYIFSGWSDIPVTMPAKDVMVTGFFERHYDVGNVVSLVNLILTGVGENDDLALYDLNDDGKLNIGDLILVVRNVLNNTNRSATTRAVVEMVVPDLSQYTAAQFVLNVPNNVSEQDISLAKGVSQTHQMMCRQIEPGTYAVVIYSLTNSLFRPEEGGIIEVNTENADSSDLTIQDVVLAKPNGETERFESMPIVTVIPDVERQDDHRSVYDLKGLKQNRVEGLRKGIYIENGKKVMVR